MTGTGAFHRCLDETYDGATASTLVQDMLLNPESTYIDTFSAEEQSEFFFQLFRTFVIGGSLCQGDETLAPYEDMVRRFYKALLSVRKHPNDPQSIQITSRVYAVDADSLGIASSPWSTCFVIVDPSKWRVTCWLHPFQRFW